MKNITLNIIAIFILVFAPFLKAEDPKVMLETTVPNENPQQKSEKKSFLTPQLYILEYQY